MADKNARSTLSDQLEDVVHNLPDGQLTISDLMDRSGAEGLLLISALLTLVFLIPISLPGLSTAFGAVILLVGVSRLLNRPLWLPRRVREHSVAAKKLRPVLLRGLTWVRRLEKVCRTRRLTALADGRVIDIFNNLAFILAALLLMSPFGFVPLSNTLPGLAVLLYAMGLAQRDGVAVLLGHLVTLSTLLYFSLLIGGGGMALKQWLWG